MGTIIRVRNEDGSIIEVPAFVGPQGPEGKQGLQGERGPSGVYVGSGDIPEDCNVQIDPNSTGETYVEEEWTFTLEDGSTVTKKILVVASE